MTVSGRRLRLLPRTGALHRCSRPLQMDLTSTHQWSWPTLRAIGRGLLDVIEVPSPASEVWRTVRYSLYHRRVCLRLARCGTAACRWCWSCSEVKRKSLTFSSAGRPSCFLLAWCQWEGYHEFVLSALLKFRWMSVASEGLGVVVMQLDFMCL